MDTLRGNLSYKIVTLSDTEAWLNSSNNDYGAFIIIDAPAKIDAYYLGETLSCLKAICLVGVISGLEQAPKKLIDFFDKSLLQRFDFERFLIVRTIPFKRKAV